MTTLYGIPNCDTVKRARAWLDEHHVAYTFHDFKKQGVPEAELDVALRSLTAFVEKAGTGGGLFRRLQSQFCFDVARHTDVAELTHAGTAVLRSADGWSALAAAGRSQGTTIVMVLHELGLAARYSDHLIAMHQGQIYAAGTPAEVVTETMMQEVFHTKARVITDPISGAPLVMPIGRHHVTTN